jgi:peptidoglycan hydrolase-like protein with peptidoglycan-binding domain
MRKHLGLALSIGLAFAASAAFGQDKDQNPPRNPPPSGNTERPGEKIETGTLKLSLTEMQRVQQALVRRGYPIANPDGKLGADTKKAVKKFQTDVGIQTSGRVDIATLNALGFGAIVAIAPDVKNAELVHTEVPGVTEMPAGLPKDANIVGASMHPIGYVAIGTTELKAIEKRLSKDGYYKGKTDGAFSRELVDAVRAFQNAKAIRSTQLFDLNTLAWFPESGIAVDVTEKPSSEINEPSWFRSIERTEGMGEGAVPNAPRGTEPVPGGSQR